LKFALFDLAHRATTGTGARVKNELLIPPIGEDKIMASVFRSFHPAEVEFIGINGDKAATRNSGGAKTTSPGVMTEAEYG
jgi:hypothetical protein